MRGQGIVKCADCGFLALRHRVTKELQEVSGDIRDTGRLPLDTIAERESMSREPICFAMQANLVSELHAPWNCKDVIDRDRQCVKWIPWKQGYTPKEHDHMLASEIAERRANELATSTNRYVMIAAIVQGVATLLAVLFGYLLTRNSTQLPAPIVHVHVPPQPQ